MTTRLWGGFLAAVAALTVTYLVVPEPTVQGLAWMAIGWAPVGAIVAGVLRHRPATRGPWWLMAAGLAASGVAWMLTPASQELTASGLRGAVGDVLHLACTLMIGTAALWFARLQTPDDDRNSVIDGVIVAVAVATVVWSASIALGADASVSGRLVFVLAPVLPAGIAAVCVRLLFTAGGRLASSRLLGGAWLLSTLGSISWILLMQAGAFAPGGWTDVLWAAALGCAGASALHPSMVDLSRRTALAHGVDSRARIVVLGVALIATPLALLTTVGLEQVHVVVPIAGAGVIAVLVLARLARLVNDREQARHELEVRASRQEVVARLGEAALGDRRIESLFHDAATLVAGVLDDVDVTVRAADADTHPTLDVVTRDGRALGPDERALLTSVMAVLSGVATRRQVEEELRQRALFDGLTGLPNRALILERLGHAVAQRDRGPVGVLFVDLDDFKPINDEYGHEAGDALLTDLAARLPRVLRAGDTVGRLAGDEFIVVAPDCDEDGLTELAGRLLAAVVEPVELAGTSVSVGASIGGTLAGRDDRDPRQVLRRADAAMYEAKDAGGGTVLAPPDPAPYEENGLGAEAVEKLLR